MGMGSYSFTQTTDGQVIADGSIERNVSKVTGYYILLSA